jgi:FixJ family two-component response regulator
MRKALDRLLRAVGFDTTTFGSAEEFLSCAIPEQHACLILDIKLPGMSGLELSRQLEAGDKHIPTIFITAQEKNWQYGNRCDISGDVCLIKPFSESVLLSAVRSALSPTSPAG